MRRLSARGSDDDHVIRAEVRTCRERDPDDRVALDLQRDDAIEGPDADTVRESLDARSGRLLQEAGGEQEQRSKDRHRCSYTFSQPEARAGCEAGCWKLAAEAGCATDGAERMEVVCHVAKSGSIAGDGLVERYRAPRTARARAGCGDGGARRRGAARGEPCRAAWRLAVVFVLLQVLTPIHQAIGANLGDRTAAWLYDRLTEACVRPPGMGHLEDPALTNDLTVARDFDLGMTGPPLSISMDFIAGGLVETDRRLRVRGAASLLRLVGAAPARRRVAGARHWLLRESGVWRDRNTDEVRGAQRDADYAYRLAVDPPASKELRLFGLAGWTIDRFVARRTRLHELQYEATRLREKPVLVEPAPRHPAPTSWCSGRSRTPPRAAR